MHINLILILFENGIVYIFSPYHHSVINAPFFVIRILLIRSFHAFPTILNYEVSTTHAKVNPFFILFKNLPPTLFAREIKL